MKFEPTLRWAFAIPVAIVIVMTLGHAAADSPSGFTTKRTVSQSGIGSQALCRIDLCRVLVINDVEIPALEEGPIVSVGVSEGQFVQEGAHLFHIDDTQAQLQKRVALTELAAAETRASSDINVRYARGSFDAADAEVQQGIELNSKREGLVSESDMRRRRLARFKAELEIEKSKLDLEVAKMDIEVQKAALGIADEQIRRRRIVSPFDGNVIWVYRGQDNQRVAQVGQWVQAGESVLRVMRMDRLYVEGLVSAAEFSPAEIDGCRVIVTTFLARDRKVEFAGKVVFISPTVDKRNNYRIRAEVENRRESNQWLLRPGVTATMTLRAG